MPDFHRALPRDVSGFMLGDVKDLIRVSGLLLLLSLWPSCTRSDPPELPPCSLTLEEIVKSQGLSLSSDHPLMPSPVLYPDLTLPDTAGLVIDARPLSRGDHAVSRYWLDPARCEAVGGVYPWGPAEHDGGSPYEARVGEPDHPTWRVRALLVTGPDGGVGDDIVAWDKAFQAMAVEAVHLHRPTRTRLTQAITDLCANVDEQHSVVMILAGRATPSAGGAFYLKHEAVSYASLLDQVPGSCTGAGLLITVIDAGYAGGVGTAGPPTMPTLVWRASDAVAPWGPRLATTRGGLLSQALGGEVAGRATALCLGVFHAGGDKGYKAVDPSPSQVADVFSPPNLRTRMQQLRWVAVGLPALQASAAQTERDPTLQTGFKDALQRDIPATLLLTSGTPSSDQNCSLDADCQDAFSGCPLPTCRRWGCVDGQCTLVDFIGASCSDDNACTLDDSCAEGGICVRILNDCSDDNPCTLDSCEMPAGCVHFPKDPGLPCDDESACTEGELCDTAGTCTGTAIVCADQNMCTGDSCDPASGCTFEPTKGTCDDGIACTHQDYCQDGSCIGVSLPCDDGNPCTLDNCDSDTGTCVHPPVLDPVGCTDGDPCTEDDHCVDGACAATPIACDDGQSCTLDTCDAGACMHLPAPNTCLAQSGCVPVGEAPVGDPCRICTATNVWNDVEGAACPDDGIPCTDDIFKGGQCTHSASATSCIDTSGACVAIGEAIDTCLTCMGGGFAAWAPAGILCEDGDACTSEDVCDGTGGCAGVPQACCPEQPPLACGASVEGDTSVGSPTDVISDWQCEGELSGGVEVAHPFVPDCDGDVELQLVGPNEAGLVVLEGSCTEGTCVGYSLGTVSLSVTQGESYHVIIETPLPGAYTVEASCTCTPP